MMQEIILFDYIKTHLDDQGRYTENQLPDRPTPDLLKNLGAEDAMGYAVDASVDTEGAQRSITLLKQYAAHPGMETRRQLTDYLNSISVSRMADCFLENFTTDDLQESMLDLAEEYFYHSSTREPLKFAYLLFGLYGMEQLQKDEPELWQNLLTIAHCEEFTFHFIYGCRITNFLPQAELWELAYCTHGWGKVYAINSLNFTTQEQRLWLIENGYDLEADYPPLSVRMITESKLGEFLKADQLDHSCFKGALAILNNFLLLTNSFDIATLNQNFNIASINLPQLLEDLLRHGEQYRENPADVLDLVALDLGLKTIMENENWYKLTFNQCNLLIAHCESIIFSQDWQNYIPAHLLNEQGKIDYILCDLAFELALDITDQLQDYFFQHPQETKLFPYLLAQEGEAYADKIIAYIENNLPLYLNSPHDLTIPLRYLAGQPGSGVNIVSAALVSIFDMPRCMACMTLEAWGPQQLTPTLLSALHTAAGLAQSPFAKACTDRLLQLAGQKLSL